LNLGRRWSVSHLGVIAVAGPTGTASHMLAHGRRWLRLQVNSHWHHAFCVVLHVPMHRNPRRHPSVSRHILLKGRPCVLEFLFLTSQTSSCWLDGLRVLRRLCCARPLRRPTPQPMFQTSLTRRGGTSSFPWGQGVQCLTVVVSHTQDRECQRSAGSVVAIAQTRLCPA